MVNILGEWPEVARAVRTPVGPLYTRNPTRVISQIFVNLSLQNLDSALSQLNVPLSVSEVHGLCCGLLCAQTSTAAKTHWFTELLDAASLAAADIAPMASQLKTMDDWFGQTLSSLNDTDLEFMPALPDDETPVGVRVRALGDFCAGFTYGIGLAIAQQGNRTLPDDSREIIEDFQAIDAADPVGEADDEGESPTLEVQENVYVELLEFVRVGVLLVLEECRPTTKAAQGSLS